MYSIQYNTSKPFNNNLTELYVLLIHKKKLLLEEKFFILLAFISRHKGISVFLLRIYLDQPKHVYLPQLLLRSEDHLSQSYKTLS